MWGVRDFAQAKRAETPQFMAAAIAEMNAQNDRAQQRAAKKGANRQGAISAALAYNELAGDNTYLKDAYDKMFPGADQAAASQGGVEGAGMSGDVPLSAAFEGDPSAVLQGIEALEQQEAAQVLMGEAEVGTAVLDPTSVAANVELAEIASAGEGLAAVETATAVEAASVQTAAEMAIAEQAAAELAVTAAATEGSAAAAGASGSSAGPYVAAAMAADQILFDGEIMGKLKDWGTGLGETLGLWS